MHDQLLQVSTVAPLSLLPTRTAFIFAVGEADPQSSGRKEKQRDGQTTASLQTAKKTNNQPNDYVHFNGVSTKGQLKRQEFQSDTFSLRVFSLLWYLFLPFLFFLPTGGGGFDTWLSVWLSLPPPSPRCSY